MALTTPGVVSGNVVGNTGAQAQTAEQAAMERMLLERQWELEDYDRKNRETEKQRQYATDMANWQKGEQEAQMKAAYEKIYAPYMQSVWDQQQGQIGGVDPRRVSGDPRLGSVYQKGAGIGQGQQPYKYGQDTNMPTDMYQDELSKAYEMWKAGKMIGIGDTKVTSTPSRMSGGSAGKSY